MYKVFKLSQVKEGFKGRVINVVDDGEAYKYYNMGFYPGNSIIIIHKGRKSSILRLGRKIVKVGNDILDRVLVVEDSQLPLVEWT